MLPFLQLYPALLCPDGLGGYQSCTREEACTDYESSFIIDWNEEISLKNWTTELDFVCMSSAKIGIMGTIVFCSIAVGSLLLGGLIDQIGRKKVVFGTVAVMPIVQVVWLIYPSLITIYIGLFFIGFCYSVRASAGYVFTSESLLTSQKLPYCVRQFSTDGMLACTMSILFWVGVMTWRRLVAFNMTCTLYLIYYLTFHLHESPQYLYSKEKWSELRSCLCNIAKRNGIQSY